MNNFSPWSDYLIPYSIHYLFFSKIYIALKSSENVINAVRIKEFNYVIELEKIKPVIFCGDLNVAHKEIDLKNPKSNERNAGFTIEERSGFENIVKHGFIDSFRYFNSEGDNYTWWSYMGGARSRNVGWRIDYFCTSQILSTKLKSSNIHSEILGSDHCPVSIDIDF